MVVASTTQRTPPPARPAEVTEVHTRVLRCMLATEDCYAYWRHVELDVPANVRAARAFEARWFGTKSEARVHTIMTDMLERFDAFPEALALLRAMGHVPAVLRPWICHVHLQLADPVYRSFSGDLLPKRRALGMRGIDREIVARWADELAPGRWSTSTCLKFGSNLLATALEAGLLGGRRDPRALIVPEVPGVILGYVLHLLRGVTIAGSLTDNPYLRSLIGEQPFDLAVVRVPGVRFASRSGVGDLSFDEPSLMAYGLAHMAAAS